MVDIIVPPLGESVTEATIAKWLVKEGDNVTADQAVCELETDKVTLEVNAPSAGVLKTINAKPGSNVGVGAILGAIEAGASAAKGPSTVASVPQTVANEAKPQPVTTATVTEKPAASAPQPSMSSAATNTTDLSPAVRKMIGDHNLNAASIPASGADGRLTKDDVQKYLDAKPAAPATSPVASAPAAAREPRQDSPREERVRMTKLRQTIAKRLKEAQNTAAMLTTFNEVDMSAVMNLRGSFKDAFEKKHKTKLGFMSFFVKAAVAALKEFPAVNAEIDGDDLVYKNFYDIGVAVSTPNWPCRAGPPRRGSKIIRRHRSRDRRLRQAGGRGKTGHQRDAGRHLHHHQWWRLRLDDVDPDPERPAIRYSRHAFDQRTPRRRQRPDRHPPDDVYRLILRPPRRRRPRSGKLPGADQGCN